jgi:hypothetical protein
MHSHVVSFLPPRQEVLDDLRRPGEKLFFQGARIQSPGKRKASINLTRMSAVGDKNLLTKALREKRSQAQILSLSGRVRDATYTPSYFFPPSRNKRL